MISLIYEFLSLLQLKVNIFMTGCHIFGGARKKVGFKEKKLSTKSGLLEKKMSVKLGLRNEVYEMRSTKSNL